jgi:putative NIF3 family GTP cyclohydrolase 1 type 2
MEKYTVGEIIDIILNSIPDSIRKNTVDILKNGCLEMEVTGIITAFNANMDVIKKAIDLNANFIIVHEPTYYNHEDLHLDYVVGSEVFQTKKELLEKHNITVWRFHDNWHIYYPDGILTGTLNKMSWQNYQDKDNQWLCHINEIKLSELVDELKSTFKLNALKVVGNPACFILWCFWVTVCTPGTLEFDHEYGLI